MGEKIYSVDWFSNNIPMWTELFKQLGLAGKENLKFLEIGCFEGRATNFLLDNVLTHKSSTIDVVDTFQGSSNEAGMRWQGEDQTFDNLHDVFVNNISDNKDRVIIHVGNSSDILKTEFENGYFDFVYIDGSHKSYDVLTDAILVHPLLKIGGIIIFDDFGWKDPKIQDVTNSPELGIRSFLMVYKNFYHIAHAGYQVAVMKTTNVDILDSHIE